MAMKLHLCQRTFLMLLVLRANGDVRSRLHSVDGGDALRSACSVARAQRSTIARAAVRGEAAFVGEPSEGE